MIITKLKLDAFGGLTGKELEFSPGLNVILGPNEAGKSTSFNAIQKALLVPSKLNKLPFKNEIERFVPIGGGDTAQVELHFEHGGEPYVLKKTWGGTKAAELKLPDGSLITDDTAITERLESLLPARKATMQSVLMTYQSGLEATLSDLEEDTEAIHSLSDLLRRAVMESDGIPVEDFREAVQAERDSYFSLWDSQTSSPRNGRGINNPWVKSVGDILDAFYIKERAAHRLEQSLTYERELDRINGEIGELAVAIGEKDAFIQANEKVVEDARQRETLEATRRGLELSVKDIHVVNSSWPVLISDIERINKELPGLEGRHGELEKEKELAQKAENGKKLKEKYERVLRKKNARDEVEQELGRTKRLTRDELEEIREASDALNIASTSMSAGKLAAAFHAKSAMTLKVTSDMDPGADHKFDQVGDLSVDAGGRIRFEHADWSMEITSGEVDFSKMQASYDDAKAALAGLLAKYGVESLEEAIRINSAYEVVAGRLDTAGKNLEEELDSDEYEVLEASAKEIDEAGSTRTVADIAVDLANTENHVNKITGERNEKQKDVDRYIEVYGSQDDLLLKLAEEASEQKKIIAELENLSPLPDGFEFAADFISCFKESKRERDTVKSQKADLEIERAELTSVDESSEELQTLLDDASAQFEATLRKGEAIARIADLTESILEESGGDIYQELEHDLERYVATITDNRYTKVEMDEGLPQGFKLKNNAVVLYALMSHGTRDVLGLALRLSMANHFLKETDGFLAMDDPMVNLDPERQEKAAMILKDYAANKQVLVFTCHPSHAELLGGNLIQM